MPTYELLTNHLNLHHGDELILDLDEIERIIGEPLPITARRRPQYWANTVKEEHRNPPNEAAKRAGFSAFLIP